MHYYQSPNVNSSVFVVQFIFYWTFSIICGFFRCFLRRFYSFYLHFSLSFSLVPSYKCWPFMYFSMLIFSFVPEYSTRNWNMSLFFLHWKYFVFPIFAFFESNSFDCHFFSFSISLSFFFFLFHSLLFFYVYLYVCVCVFSFSFSFLFSPLLNISLP